MIRMENSRARNDGTGDEGRSNGEGESNADSSTPRLNPLIDPYILRIVFQYLNVDGLKACRETNRNWNELATPFLKKKAMIYFNEHYDEEEDPPEDLENEFYRDVHNYMKTMQHFQVDSYCLGKGAKYTEQLAELQEFFCRFGPSIKYLRLDYEFHSHFNVEHLRRFLTENLPILEHLDIRNMPVAVGQMTKRQELIVVRNPSLGHSGSDEFPVFWPRSAGPRKSFPNIKRIDLWNYNAYVGELGRNFVDDLLQVVPNLECIQIVDRYYKDIVKYVLEAIQSNPSWVPKLNQILLDCCGSPTLHDIQILSELNIKLKVLRLGTLPPTDKPDLLQAILNKQSPTLQELQFGNYVGKTSIKVTLPNFPRLQVFELTQDVPKAARYNITFDPVNYEKQFPVLKELANCRNRRFYEFDDLESLQRSPYEGKGFFRGMTDLWKSLFPDDGQVCKTLRILDIPYSKETTSTKFYQRLAKMFPLVDNPTLNKARLGD